MLNHSVNPNTKKIGEPVFQPNESTQNIVQRWGIIKKTKDMDIT